MLFGSRACVAARTIATRRNAPQDYAGKVSGRVVRGSCQLIDREDSDGHGVFDSTRSLWGGGASIRTCDVRCRCVCSASINHGARQITKYIKIKRVKVNVKVRRPPGGCGVPRGAGAAVSSSTFEVGAAGGLPYRRVRQLLRHVRSADWQPQDPLPLFATAQGRRGVRRGHPRGDDDGPWSRKGKEACLEGRPRCGRDAARYVMRPWL